MSGEPSDADSSAELAKIDSQTVSRLRCRWFRLMSTICPSRISSLSKVFSLETTGLILSLIRTSFLMLQQVFRSNGDTLLNLKWGHLTDSFPTIDKMSPYLFRFILHCYTGYALMPALIAPSTVPSTNSLPGNMHSSGVYISVLHLNIANCHSLVSLKYSIRHTGSLLPYAILSR